MNNGDRLDRTMRHTIPPEKRFMVDAVFADEYLRAQEWLSERANEAYSNMGADSARAHASTVAQQVINVLGNPPDKFNIALLNDAKNGVLRTHVPSLARIHTYKAISYVCLALEVVVAGVQIIVSDAGPAVLIPGVLLAIAAMLTGFGLGGLWSRTLGFPSDWKATPPQNSGTVKHLLELLVGVALVLGMTAIRLRSLDGDERWVVVGVTLALAALGAAFLALHAFDAVKYECLWERMYDAQVFEAQTRHDKNQAFYEKFFVKRIGELSDGKGALGLRTQ